MRFTNFKQASAKKLACAAALGLALSAFGAVPALAAETPAEPAADAAEAVADEPAADAVEADAAEEQGFIGSWELVSMIVPPEQMEAMGGAEMSGEDMAAAMAMMGMNYSLEVNEDGTFAMSMTVGEETQGGEGTWEQVDETTAVFTANDQAIEVVMDEDGRITMPMDEESALIFGREGTRTSSISALTTIDDPEGFAYAWKMVAMESSDPDQNMPEELFAMLEVLGMKGIIVFDEDGTFALTISMGEEGAAVEGAWEQTGDAEAVLTAAIEEGGSEESLTIEVVDGRLRLGNPQDPETVLVFAAIDPQAWEAYQAAAEAPADEAAADEAPADEAAADEAAADEAAAGALADGTYEAAGKGIGGDVPVTVTVEGGVIVSVEVGENSETQGIGSKAIEQLPELIVEAGGVEGVEGVSGASVTSKAIFSAVADCLEQASA